MPLLTPGEVTAALVAAVPSLSGMESADVVASWRAWRWVLLSALEHLPFVAQDRTRWSHIVAWTRAALERFR
jgi:hypothetical protein